MSTIRRLVATAHDIGWTGRILGYLGATILVGLLAGLLWHGVISLPSYTATEDGSVVMTERAQSQYFVTDAVFSLIGLLAGLAVGFGAWMLFNRIGWPVSFVAIAGGAGSGGLCWLVGEALGPSDFASRVAAAQPGDHIPIDFALHAPAALLLWCLGAIIPVMLYANMSTLGAASGRAERSSKPKAAVEPPAGEEIAE